jgi:hypothetical protein
MVVMYEYLTFSKIVHWYKVRIPQVLSVPNANHRSIQEYTFCLI